MTATAPDLETLGRQAKQAARELARLKTEFKNQILLNLAQALRQHQEEILASNFLDYSEAKEQGLSEAMLDRLRLDAARIEGMAREVEAVARLEDPVGQEFDQRLLPHGLKIKRRRTPLGVVGVIYESRPNVTVDVAVLCFKTGNAVILRGGKETLRTNKVLVRILQTALQEAQLNPKSIQLIDSPDRDLVKQMLHLDKYIDMLIPRGGAELHRFCLENSTIPVITGGIGVCHLYADAFLDLDAAVPVIYNAKVQRPTVCNALDTLLVHHLIAPDLIPLLCESLAPAGVEIRADVQSYPLFEAENYPKLVHATHQDWGTEFLDLVLSVRMVEDLDEALDHIAQYSSGHSEAILTLKSEHAERFLDEVDSAAVYVNASTRFTDGAQFGLGAEVAVSTQKLHARGPMALEGLTTYKWLVEGRWSVRP
ncbi:glutamate-5-semialdehyde dehydrogenase [bacterium (Candidatus Blackallbacteria) CG17_big_fil_post_rev_8_21_14_2_50_48_46]|uniref:Gamma-glutamyl phosphate reductase n=1 Tax=bacterium (Candidatus Blackallbacteria) CG17_big_fil_post_rev_8_21_14_2_50_48_46 TaxID=2014261 RepID=A0A2M7G8V2_9BACT|nr:MAG: glutamate-5-semialdehyde dehydrogenase [bacterium (Candidatus Blackallbacteria) CG18_big_fil_WC_8_21_14_2_50_49_26]PIW18546.1 MAG: glutamate-5-semialdehyde dehydrogenase [bacterium (Candidatus Blackallbacteria) CG17_big_fil_post_rev_8_21_14_2_50_48_46]PIW46469.1 MAG: glutamate-5-semialdehyde dehydrogenase [bacterium (Candidatus Blackallbacteria) CG13_big_fil_rev_8_21_14_2_50_49_14]